MSTQTSLRTKTRKKPPSGIDFRLRKKTSEPLYQQVQARITDHIAKGRLREGDRLPSLQRLSDEMGIAYATVARGVRMLVESGVLEARSGSGTQVAAQRTWRVHQAGTINTFAKETGLIGYIGNDTAEDQHDFHYLNIVAGIEAMTSEQEKRLILLNRRSKFGWDRVDGMLVQDANPARIVSELPQGMPCVCLLRTTEGVAGVVADDYNGARLGVHHLVELGHRRIAYLVQRSVISEIPLLRQRVNGFQDALREADIEPEADWVYNVQVIPVKGYASWGYQNMRQWLRAGFAQSGFTALFAQNDVAAIGAIRALREAGLRVPEDISVLSFDGTPICQLYSPTIAAIAVPLRQIGTTAMELLARQISSGQAGHETIVLPTRFQDGESIAAPRKNRVVPQ